MNNAEGHIVEFCKDQNNSCFIQQGLEIRDESEKEMVMIEVLPKVGLLINK